jgi:hypothetical protein
VFDRHPDVIDQHKTSDLANAQSTKATSSAA